MHSMTVPSSSYSTRVTTKCFSLFFGCTAFHLLDLSLRGLIGFIIGACTGSDSSSGRHPRVGACGVWSAAGDSRPPQTKTVCLELAQHQPDHVIVGQPVNRLDRLEGSPILPGHFDEAGPIARGQSVALFPHSVSVHCKHQRKDKLGL